MVVKDTSVDNSIATARQIHDVGIVVCCVAEGSLTSAQNTVGRVTGKTDALVGPSGPGGG
jgi:hypothetical protein